MPLTVSELFDFQDLYEHYLQDEDDPDIVEELKRQGLYDLQVQGPVRWGKKVRSDSRGVYVVSLSDTPEKNNNLKERIPICETKIEDVWLKNAQYMTIDGQKANKENIKRFLSEVWLPKESILYIGQTTNLNKRVMQYYNQKLGKGNHSGGQWLCALSICSKTFVYYVEIETKIHKEVEKNLLQNFDFHVRKAGNNNAHVLPFANLTMKTKNANYDKNKRMNQQSQ